MGPLRQAFDCAKEGDRYIFPRTITGATNLWKGLESIIKKAGLSSWPKLFQNLRASRETELCQKHQLHVVAAWIGNTPTIAMGHYLQVIDSDWEKATSTTEKSITKSDTLGAKTTHFNTHCGGSETFTNIQDLIGIFGNSSVLFEITEEMKGNLMGAEGIEPPTNTV